jgi:hypothetical protein
MGRPDAAVLVRRAISVQLATVTRGQPRLLQPTWTGRSAAYTGVAALLPKLKVPLLYCLRRGLRLKDGPGSARAATVSAWLR